MISDIKLSVHWTLEDVHREVITVFTGEIICYKNKNKV